MNHNITLEYQNVRVRPLYYEDIESLRMWRNNSENSRFLTKLPYITQKMQEEWYSEYLNDKNIYVWAIDSLFEEYKLTGSVALYSFCDGKCEQGKIMIASEYANRGIGTVSLILTAHIGFSKMNISLINAFVNCENTASLKMFFKVGYSSLDVQINAFGEQEHHLSISKSEFNKANEFALQSTI